MARLRGAGTCGWPAGLTALRCFRRNRGNMRSRLTPARSHRSQILTLLSPWPSYRPGPCASGPYLSRLRHAAVQTGRYPAGGRAARRLRRRLAHRRQGQLSFGRVTQAAAPVPDVDVCPVINVTRTGRAYVPGHFILSVDKLDTDKPIEPHIYHSHLFSVGNLKG